MEMVEIFFTFQANGIVNTGNAFEEFLLFNDFQTPLALWLISSDVHKVEIIDFYRKLRLKFCVCFGEGITDLYFRVYFNICLI
jgi:hypothetical protein